MTDSSDSQPRYLTTLPDDPVDVDYTIENVVAKGSVPHELNLEGILEHYAIDTWEELEEMFASELFEHLDLTWDNVLGRLTNKSSDPDTLGNLRDSFELGIDEAEISDEDQSRADVLAEEAKEELSEYKGGEGAANIFDGHLLTELQPIVDDESYTLKTENIGKYFREDTQESYDKFDQMNKLTTLTEVSRAAINACSKELAAALQHGGSKDWDTVLDEIDDAVLEVLEAASDDSASEFSLEAIEQRYTSGDDIVLIEDQLADHHVDFIVENIDSFTSDNIRAFIAEQPSWDELTSGELTKEKWDLLRARTSEKAWKYVTCELGERAVWNHEGGFPGLYIGERGMRRKEGMCDTFWKTTYVIRGRKISHVNEKREELLRELYDKDLLPDFHDMLQQSAYTYQKAHDLYTPVSLLNKAMEYLLSEDDVTDLPDAEDVIERFNDGESLDDILPKNSDEQYESLLAKAESLLRYPDFDMEREDIDALYDTLEAAFDYERTWNEAIEQLPEEFTKTIEAAVYHPDTQFGPRGTEDDEGHSLWVGDKYESWYDHDFKVVNIVANADYGRDVMLEEFTGEFEDDTQFDESWGRIEYMPDEFTAPVIRDVENDAVILVFNSGKLVILGGDHPDRVEAAVKKMTEYLDEYMVLQDILYGEEESF